MELASAIKFLLDFTKTVVNWSNNTKQENRDEIDRLAKSMDNISLALIEYAESLQKNDSKSQGIRILQRYYLDHCLQYIAYAIDNTEVSSKTGSDLRYPMIDAVEHLKRIKILDEPMAPEIGTIFNPTEELTLEKRQYLIEQMYKVSGEFKAAAELFRVS